MDCGTAIAIAVPASTFIVSIAVIIVKSMKQDESSKSTNNLFVRRTECNTIVTSFGKSLDNMRFDLVGRITSLDKKLESLRKDLGK